jgi:DNA-directed RNA polymerase specialized sigma24 family protein
MDTGADSELGRRLADQEGRLRLLLLHLSGPAVRARVEIEDLLHEIYLRALATPEKLPGPDSDKNELFRYLRVIARHTIVDVVRAARAAKRDGSGNADGTYAIEEGRADPEAEAFFEDLWPSLLEWMMFR